MDLTKMTRMRAEKMVAETNDLESLQKLGDHKNKHVRAKASFKFQKLSQLIADRR